MSCGHSLLLEKQRGVRDEGRQTHKEAEAHQLVGGVVSGVGPTGKVSVSLKQKHSTAQRADEAFDGFERHQWLAAHFVEVACQRAFVRRASALVEHFCVWREVCASHLSAEARTKSSFPRGSTRAARRDARRSAVRVGVQREVLEARQKRWPSSFCTELPKSFLLLFQQRLKTADQLGGQKPKACVCRGFYRVRTQRCYRSVGARRKTLGRKCSDDERQTGKGKWESEKKPQNLFRVTRADGTWFQLEFRLFLFSTITWTFVASQNTDRFEGVTRAA